MWLITDLWPRENSMWQTTQAFPPNARRRAVDLRYVARWRSRRLTGEFQEYSDTLRPVHGSLARRSRGRVLKISWASIKVKRTGDTKTQEGKSSILASARKSSQSCRQRLGQVRRERFQTKQKKTNDAETVKCEVFKEFKQTKAVIMTGWLPGNKQSLMPEGILIKRLRWHLVITASHGMC